MVNRPSVPEIITVNSETLQTQIRDLLPSQNGFGSELQASNVITPVIDLTAAAEGSGLPSYLQTALAFSSITTFSVNNATNTVLLNQTGFFRVYGNTAHFKQSGSLIEFNLFDGATSKTIVQYNNMSTASDTDAVTNFDFIVFLAAGISLRATLAASSGLMTGVTQQIATGDGTLVQPGGYPL